MKHVRRMPKRFLDGAPEHIADIFDHPGTGDRYTVFYRDIAESAGRAWVWYRAMSANPFHPQGIGLSGEMCVHAFSAYRQANRRKRIMWFDLPPDVQRCAIQDGN